MLATTVSYLSLLENKRHNLVTEKQTDTDLNIRQQSVNIQAGQLEETKRHNAATEAISWGNLNELVRHNTVTEGINMFDASTRRQQLDINKFEAETHRYSAIQNAGIGWANVAVNQGQLAVSQQRANNDYEIARINANTNIKNAETQANRLDEEVRYHDVSILQEGRRIETQQEQNEIRRSELDWRKEIEQKQYEMEKLNNTWRNINQSIETGTNLFSSIVDASDKLSDNFVPIEGFTNNGEQVYKKRRKK